MDIIIYGEKQDENVVTSILDRQPLLAFRQRQYFFCSTEEEYIRTLEATEPELIIVTADGEKGRDGVDEAFRQFPKVARMWFPKEKEYLAKSYELQCTWFTPKPITEEILIKAIERYYNPKKTWCS